MLKAEAESKKSWSDVNNRSEIDLINIDILKDEYKVVAWRCTIGTFVIFVVTIVCVTLEALAGLAQQFCHGEDLVMFIWGTWTLFQM